MTYPPGEQIKIEAPQEGDERAGTSAFRAELGDLTSELIPPTALPQFLEKQQSRALCTEKGNYHQVIITKITSMF